MKKILVVDDNTDNLEMMEIILTCNNFTVVSAINGKIALEKLRSEKFELIISDILMPIMDGFMFCKECKQNKKFSSIPFIFYTATYIDSLDKSFALSLGAQEFITKPQEPEVLLSIILRVINEADESKFATNAPTIQDETEIMKLYSERLISKLEKKNIELEKEINSHKQTLVELQVAKEKAEVADKLKTAFLQNISHEIRTPLNGILGFSDLLNRYSVSADDIKEYTGIISKSSHRLLDIINNVLDISKIETGQIEILKKTFSLNLIMDNLYAFFTPLAAKKGIKFSYTAALDNDNCYIISDDTKLHQILTNIINNSIKFTQSGTILYGYEVLNDKLQFFVKDTGIGIPQENIEKIFDRFTPVDLVKEHSLKGAGLGLAICKGLIEKLGGEIQVDSEVDKGTDFYFSIPYIHAQSVFINNQDDILAKPYKVLMVLIAEDDENCFELLRRILIDSGFKILHADNGVKAVELVINHPEIDLILMDIRMPLMDGIEATKKIRELMPNIPIIAQTAFAFNEERDKIIEAGCNNFLTKPIESDLLLKMIDNLIEN